MLEQASHCLRQLLTHLLLVPGVGQRLTAGGESAGIGHPHQGKPVAHGGDHAMGLVPGGGDCPDQRAPSPPGQGLSAVHAEVALPVTVGHLPQGRQDRGPGVTAHRHDRGDVLEYQHAAGTDLAQYPAGGVARPLLGGGARQQRSL